MSWLLATETPAALLSVDLGTGQGLLMQSDRSFCRGWMPVHLSRQTS